MEYRNQRLKSFRLLSSKSFDLGKTATRFHCTMATVMISILTYSKLYSRKKQLCEFSR